LIFEPTLQLDYLCHHRYQKQLGEKRAHHSGKAVQALTMTGEHRWGFAFRCQQLFSTPKLGKSLSGQPAAMQWFQFHQYQAQLTAAAHLRVEEYYLQNQHVVKP
jgi:hypothetical protein